MSQMKNNWSRLILEKIFFKDIIYRDGTHEARVSPARVMIVLLGIIMLVIVVFSEWTCAGCHKKSFELKDLPHVAMVGKN